MHLHYAAGRGLLQYLYLRNSKLISVIVNGMFLMKTLGMYLDEPIGSHHSGSVYFPEKTESAQDFIFKSGFYL